MYFFQKEKGYLSPDTLKNINIIQTVPSYGGKEPAR